MTEKTLYEKLTKTIAPQLFPNFYEWPNTTALINSTWPNSLLVGGLEMPRQYYNNNAHRIPNVVLEVLVYIRFWWYTIPAYHVYGNL